MSFGDHLVIFRAINGKESYVQQVRHIPIGVTTGERRTLSLIDASPAVVCSQARGTRRRQPSFFRASADHSAGVKGAWPCLCWGGSIERGFANDQVPTRVDGGDAKCRGRDNKDRSPSAGPGPECYQIILLHTHTQDR